MNTYKLVLPAIGLLASASAHAQWRCDCTAIVDSCSADVTVRGSSIDVTTDSQQCARVDYFIDGQPFVAVAVEGQARQDWIARSDDPRVMVQSCQVCRENTAAPQSPASAQAAPAAGEETGGELEPLIEVAPAYPAAARERGIAGYVDVEFAVTPLGDVQNARVTASQPTGVFDNAALAAVARWRYPSDPEREPQTVTRRLDFRPADAAARSPSDAQGAVVRSDRPRNQCVRENVVYNYGEMIEVGLMNACQEPLLVYGCGEGTGRYVGRWVCVASEQQQILLAPPEDDRIGRAAQVTAPNGAQATYTYSDSFFVTRAPNSQYWWVACAENDGGCRADAGLWVRAMDRQPATVNPQARAQISVARSQ
jgi:TonB family protein